MPEELDYIRAYHDPGYDNEEEEDGEQSVKASGNGMLKNFEMHDIEERSEKSNH